MLTNAEITHPKRNSYTWKSYMYMRVISDTQFRIAPMQLLNRAVEIEPMDAHNYTYL